MWKWKEGGWNWLTLLSPILLWRRFTAAVFIDGKGESKSRSHHILRRKEEEKSPLQRTIPHVCGEKKNGLKYIFFPPCGKPKDEVSPLFHTGQKSGFTDLYLWIWRWYLYAQVCETLCFNRIIFPQIVKRWFSFAGKRFSRKIVSFRQLDGLLWETRFIIPLFSFLRGKCVCVLSRNWARGEGEKGCCIALPT